MTLLRYFRGFTRAVGHLFDVLTRNNIVFRNQPLCGLTKFSGRIRVLYNTHSCVKRRSIRLRNNVAFDKIECEWEIG